MDTKLKYIKIALLISLALLVIIICVFARKLSTMECAETAPLEVMGVPEKQDTSPRSETTLLLNDSNKSELPPIPPPSGDVPTAAETEAFDAQHEAEGAAIPKTYPVQTEGVMTPEEALKKFGGNQNTPPTTPQ